MPYALGFDSSTQGITAVLLDLGTRRVAGTLQVPFGDFPEYRCPRGFLEDLPGGQFHANPSVWLAALEALLAKAKAAGWALGEVTAISGSGQQHGSVYLKAGWLETVKGLDPARPLAVQLDSIFARATAPIWMDGSTGEECAQIAAAVGGNPAVCARSGSIAVERFTGPQIRAFFRRDPAGYAATARIHLVSSFLCSVLAGADAAIDPGDGAGMNLMDLARNQWDPALLDATAPGLVGRLPALAPSATWAGRIGGYFVRRFGFAADCRVQLFSGDNPCSLVGMGAAQPGRVVVSLGTSDTLFAAMPAPRTDPEGCGHVFGNPMGGCMTLACIRNGSLAREAFRDRLGVDWSAFEAAGSAELPADAVTLPFVADEITPRRAAGLKETRPDLAAPQRVRAFLEGQAFNLRRQLDWMGLTPTSIALTGGAARNGGIAQVFADVFGVPAGRLTVGNSAAQGAAMRAAAAAGVPLAAMEEALCKADSLVVPKAAAATAARMGKWRRLLAGA